MTRRSLMRRPVAALAPALLACALSTTPARSGDVTDCTISAWSTDASAAGLNVRAGPGVDSPIIASLAAKDGFAPEVTITGSAQGWFRISQAIENNYNTDELTVLFSGVGWVSGRSLGLLLNNSYLHSAPAPDSATLAHLFSETENTVQGPDSFDVKRLLACQGDWVEVEGTFLDTSYRGWARNTCSNQVTTCP